jgi:hypothetical protein
MKTLKIFKYVGFGILGLGFVALVIYVTMLLWNCLVPSLFKGPVLTYWQTAGLYILSKILLSGFSRRRHHHGMRGWRWRHDDKYRHDCYGYEEEVKTEKV